jgi:aminoglycoside phosphotransferase (APT) family kinase protein
VGKMHADELESDVPLLRRLVASQFPHWADLPIERLASSGTENAVYRLGDDMAVRLPRKPGAKEQVEKLHRWLPRLGPQLPLAIPVPLAKGEPAQDYPSPWSVCSWLEGETPTAERIGDPERMALALGQFIAALQRIDPRGGPLPGAHNFFRGVPLAARDAQIRRAIGGLHGIIDTVAATARWDAALQTPPWPRSPVWIHGDLKAENLLVVRGALNGVIDFGGLGVGDPACELIIGWELFSAETRRLFREALAVDDATWSRGRGWALSVALMALPYYLHTHPDMVRYARRLLDEVLSDPHE